MQCRKMNKKKSLLRLDSPFSVMQRLLLVLALHKSVVTLSGTSDFIILFVL